MKKGFTLVELLGVIMILGIILTITIYSVNSILNDSESSLSDVQKSTLEESAKIYYLKEGIDNESNGSYSGTVCVSVDYLANYGYLDKNTIYDPETTDEITGYVKITNEVKAGKYTDNYVYEYQSNESECSVTVSNE